MEKPNPMDLVLDYTDVIQLMKNMGFLQNEITPQFK